MNSTAPMHTATPHISQQAFDAEISRLRQHQRESRQRTTTALLATVLVLLICIIALFARPVQVHGMSMEPTFTSGDVLLVGSLRSTPAHGDVVVFTIDTLPGQQLVKRVVGLPGDVVDMDPATGQIYRNGAALDESYINTPTPARAVDTTPFPITVPEGRVFVLGDNRQTSIDSRCQEIGTIPIAGIIGAVWSVGSL